MIELVNANQGDLPRIQSILEQNRTYHMNISGKNANDNAAEKLFETLPHKKSPEDKLVLIARKGEIDLGVIDLIHGYPDADTAYLGLLAIIETEQRKGLGKEIYLAVEKLVKEVGLKKIRLAVVETNPVIPFWEKMGFQLTGEMKDYRNKKVHSQSLLMEKII